MGKRVLIIEDDGDNRQVYAVFLQHSGYEVIEAEDGEAGLELAARLLPQVIVLDIGLPGDDGYAIAVRLRADARTRNLPLIAVTGHAYPQHEARAREVGFDAFLAKPVDPMRVLAEVERWVGGGHADGQNQGSGVRGA